MPARKTIAWNLFELSGCAIIIALTLLLLVSKGHAVTPVPFHSFIPPFNFVDETSGLRTIRGWKISGDAVVNKHFVRLTPDRQSKLGWLYAKNPIGFTDWSTTLRFRLSGQVSLFYLYNVYAAPYL